MHTINISKIKEKINELNKSIFLKVIFFLIVIIFLFVIKLLITIPSYHKESTPIISSDHYYESVPIPSEIDFAGEKVPIHKFDVYESLERELLVNTFWHSQTFLMLKRSQRFFPIVVPILKKYNIPEDFKYLLAIESNFSTVVSPAGAAGYWQFMKETAKKYGLEITDEVDERYNLEKSTEAACKYLNDLYKIFKNWTLVAAAYNIGEGNLTTIISKQKLNSYYDLFFNEETARYVYRILAVKLIFSNPQKYGFFVPSSQRYYPIPVENISIDSTISDIPQFALDMGINYKILRLLNPWIRKYQLTNPTKKTYIFKIPKPEYRNIEVLKKYYSELDSTIILNTDTIK